MTKWLDYTPPGCENQNISKNFSFFFQTLFLWLDSFKWQLWIGKTMLSLLTIDGFHTKTPGYAQHNSPGGKYVHWLPPLVRAGLGLRDPHSPWGHWSLRQGVPDTSQWPPPPVWTLKDIKEINMCEYFSDLNMINPLHTHCRITLNRLSQITW